MDTYSHKVMAVNNHINDQQHFIFHISSHAIAFIALIIACFAVAGYIRYRENTIPSSSLKRGADNVINFHEKIMHHEDVTFNKDIDVLRNIQVGGAIDATYLDFLSGFQGNFGKNNFGKKGIQITTAQAQDGESSSSPTADQILACTLTKNAINLHNGTAQSKSTLGYLPPAVKGDHLALEIEGSWAGGTKTQTIEAVGAVGADKNVFARQVIDYGTGVLITNGSPQEPTSVSLIYTPAGDGNDILGRFSFIHFYCPKDNEWLVNIRSVPLGFGTGGSWNRG